VPCLAIHYDSPRRVRARRLAPQLAVDEVADASRAEPERRPRRDKIHDDEEWALNRAAVQPHRDQHAQETTVERHAAFPHAEQAEWIRDQLAQTVDQHVADAAADDRPERDVEHDVVDVLRPDQAVRVLGARPRAEPAGAEADQIHEPIPMHGHGPIAEQRPDRDRDGIESRIREQGCHRS
jgi:hypothetical protein